MVQNKTRFFKHGYKHTTSNQTTYTIEDKEDKLYTIFIQIFNQKLTEEKEKEEEEQEQEEQEEFRDIAGFLMQTAPHPYSIRILGCSPWTRSSMLRLRGEKTLS